MASLATDDFNRADSTGLGANWTTVPSNGGGFVRSNTFSSTTDDPVAAFYNGVTWPANQYAQCKILTPLSTGGDNGGGPMVRAGSLTNTAYFTLAHSTGLQIYAVVAGSYNEIGNDSTVPTNNQLLYLEANGSAQVLKLAGVTKITGADVLIASGNAGIFGAYENNATLLDDWEGGDLTGGAAATSDVAGIYRRRRINNSILVR